MGEAPLISVILPVHNQADHLREIVALYQAELKRLNVPYELLLVPNGCADDSPAIASALTAENPEIKIVATPERGWGHAVAAGLANARGELLCYTNGARTDPRDLALILLYARAYPATVVKATRKIREGFVRRLGSLLYNLECRALFDLSYWDINGTPKVFPRALAPLLALRRRDDLIDLEFNLVCRRNQYPVVEIPIFSSSRRHGGRSTTGFISAARMYWGALTLWREYRRESA
jgi:glycosyltransferase involved in cell wall biosynthesis